MARPKIDRAQAHRHTAILDDSTDRFIFAAFPDLKGCRSNPWQRSGRFADLVEEMENLQAQRYGIFVAVHAFHGDKRRKAEIKRNRALWCERDQPGLRLPLAPSLRIRTTSTTTRSICSRPTPPRAICSGSAISLWRGGWRRCSKSLGGFHPEATTAFR